MPTHGAIAMRSISQVENPIFVAPASITVWYRRDWFLYLHFSVDRIGILGILVFKPFSATLISNKFLTH
jgi:hypothetical protein